MMLMMGIEDGNMLDEIDKNREISEEVLGGGCGFKGCKQIVTIYNGGV
jgi:hypothetical protein